MRPKLIRRILVLMYHKIGLPPEDIRNPRTCVSMERFSWQMRYLRRRGYRIILPRELVFHYRGESTIYGRSVLIAFDDVSQTCLTRALPKLYELGITATVFIVEGHINSRANWNREGNGLNDALLSNNEIHQLVRNGWDIGAHSMSHTRMTELTGEEAGREIRLSKSTLENLFFIPIRTFAYPYGNFFPEHTEMVREAGFDLGVTTHYQPDDFPHSKRKYTWGGSRIKIFMAGPSCQTGDLSVWVIFKITHLLASYRGTGLLDGTSNHTIPSWTSGFFPKKGARQPMA